MTDSAPSLTDNIKTWLSGYLPVAEHEATAKHYQATIKQWILLRNYLCVGLASASTIVITQPLDLVKVRLQLQGELRPPGKHTVMYRTIFQSLSQIYKLEGVKRGLYKATSQAWLYQMLSNSVRILVFDKCHTLGLTSDMNEQPVLGRYLMASILSGCAGATIASPFYLAKIQTQAQCHPSMAVGWQHAHPEPRWVLWNCFRGHKGYLRSGFQGGTSACLRMSVASSTQLFTFTTLQHGLYSLGVHSALLNSCLSGVLSTVPVVLVSNPFDVICTRMYNQELEAHYKSIRECAEKLYRREGIRGFYKGVVANYCRTVPHMTLTLVLWHKLRSTGIDIQMMDQSYDTLDSDTEAMHKKLMSKFDS